VCGLVDMPRVPKQEMRALTDERAQSFLEAAKDDPHSLRHQVGYQPVRDFNEYDFLWRK